MVDLRPRSESRLIGTFPGQHAAVSAATVVVAGVAAGVLTWGLARLSGIDPEVGRGGDTTPVGLPDVIVASLIGGVAAWAVHALLARRGRALRWWPFVGSTALAISMIGPSYYADGESAVALMAMHFTVGFVLIFGMSLVRRC